MSRVENVDGNEYFLNKYLNEQDKHEEEPEVSDEDEFTGEVLYDLLSDKGFEEGLTELEEYAKKYPVGGFDGGVEVVKKYLSKKESMETLNYIDLLATEFYKAVGYWFDSKWLVSNYKEELVLDSTLELLSDIIYEEDVLAVEDFVESCMLGFELIEVITSIHPSERDTAYQVSLKRRVEKAREGIEQAGFDKDFLLKNSPGDVTKLMLKNTKEIGKKVKRLQVSDATAEKITGTLGLVGDMYSVENNYANIYGLFGRQPKEKIFMEVTGRFNSELFKRIQSGQGLKVITTAKLMGTLMIYRGEEYWVVIGNRFMVFKNNGDKDKLVLSKVLSEVRVKDIKQVTGAIK